MKDTAPASPASHEFTLASVQRDFVEWRGERTHYAVWAIDGDTPAVRAASAALCVRLAACLLPGYQRQPHVTLRLCGFPAAVPRGTDDYPAATLERQIAALQANAPAPFTLAIGRPDSFASAAYLSVDDRAGGIHAARAALAGADCADDGFAYTPHVTCGLYRGEFHLPTLLREMAGCNPGQPLRLQVERLNLMVYEAAIIGGPLVSLCEFDLATRQARIIERPLMERLFGNSLFQPSSKARLRSMPQR